MKRSMLYPVVGWMVCLSALIMGCPSPVPPTADFDVNPRVGAIPLEAHFTDQSTNSTTIITSWNWEFGDGATSTLQNPVHTYSTPGTYDVKLTVTSSGGSDSETKSGYVIVDPDGERTTLLNGLVPLTMVWLSACTFNMGTNAGETGSVTMEQPKHEVVLTQGFWIGKYEVTKEQWKAILNTEPWKSAGVNPYDAATSPAQYVNWNDTQTFIAALNVATGDTYRLPSEAEWECACRAGTTGRFYWGEDVGNTLIGNYAWWNGNSSDYGHEVGEKLPNAKGIYDMSGNVWEWCQDWYGPYPSTQVTDPKGPDTGTRKILRGGSWYTPDVNSNRSAARNVCDPTVLFYDFGFRLCKWD